MKRVRTPKYRVPRWASPQALERATQTVWTEWVLAGRTGQLEKGEDEDFWTDVTAKLEGERGVELSDGSLEAVSTSAADDGVVRLRALTLEGFKSFRRKTTISFDSRISAMVGPDHSGKSTIVDALLWVSGEQSPLALRGRSMQDVISAGGTRTSASTRAEVAMCLDATDLPSPSTGTLTIARWLDRGGHGGYTINGTKARLVDVLTMLSDLKLMPLSRSSISARHIEAVATATARQIGEYVEDAVDVTKLRKRRSRAARRLDATKANLRRAQDAEAAERSRAVSLREAVEVSELRDRLGSDICEIDVELERRRSSGDSGGSGSERRSQRDDASAREAATGPDNSRPLRARSSEELFRMLRMLRTRLDELTPLSTDPEPEYKTSSARATVLARQLHDLERAAEELETLLHATDAQTLAMLDERIGAVAATIDVLARECFPGTRIELRGAGSVVENDEDEALSTVQSGIALEIQVVTANESSPLRDVVSPRRELIALACALSMRTVGPHPMLILDEVDDAFGEDAIGTINRMLQILSRRAQIIAVSKRPEVAEIADTLHGVSVRHGVATVISRRLPVRGELSDPRQVRRYSTGS